MTQPAAPDVFVLDQAVIDAGRKLLAAMTADEPDPTKVDSAREALKAAKKERWNR